MDNSCAKLQKKALPKIIASDSATVRMYVWE